ncbi:MAG: thioredoxin family protein [Methanosarcinaceae archaeon]|nr:thioredoxin family protein [Methanosarcinaceae archaeon]MDF1534042.1 thioredoxin family protein [Methanosarcinaceae archaeon]
MVKVTLVYAKWCNVCPTAMKLWNDLKSKYDFEYEELDLETPEGMALVKEYSIHSVPTTIIDGKVEFIGLPQKLKAAAFVSK